MCPSVLPKATVRLLLLLVQRTMAAVAVTTTPSTLTDRSHKSLSLTDTIQERRMLKPIKHGLKIFALCCSNGNYLFAFEVYTGKDNTADGSAYETVMRMLRLRNVIERKR
jgi:hypothetical protein